MALLHVGAMLLGGGTVGAQQSSERVGRLEGTVSGTASRARDVRISVTRFDPEPAVVRAATADSLGRYAIDSLPVGRYLLELESALLDSLQLAVGAREVSIAAGATVRVDLSLPSEAAVRSALEAPPAAVDTATGELQLAGTASLGGMVRGPAGEPMPGVQLHVRDARGAAVSDSAGRYLLTGLPEGTHVLVARRLGYALVEEIVELRAAQRITHDVTLTRAVSLDSVRVTAMGGRYREFDFARGANLFGRYLTRDQILRRRPEDASALLPRLGGFTVIGHGSSARVFTKTELRARNPCETNVVIDRVQRRRINDVPPARIVGLEAYLGPDTFTTDFDAKCGLIVIWTSAWRGAPTD
jgi:hypothetical protein